MELETLRIFVPQLAGSGRQQAMTENVTTEMDLSNFSCSINRSQEVDNVNVSGMTLRSGRHFNNVNMRVLNDTPVNDFNCHVVLEDISIPKYENLLNNPITVDIDCDDGSSNIIKRCGSKRCKFQNKFSPSNEVLSSVTNRKYNYIVPDGTTYLNCHSSNLVYLITCNNCSLKYVGETVQKLNERFAFHNTCILYPNKYGFCRILSSHFNKGPCKNAEYSVQIIEKMEGSGRTERGAINIKASSERKEREKYWMLKLRTVYPYGLNDRIGDEFKHVQNHSCVGKNFFALERQYQRLSRGRFRSSTEGLSIDIFLSTLKHHLENNISLTMNYIRISLSSMKKSKLKELHIIISNEIAEQQNDFMFLQWYLAIIDVIESKLYSEPYEKKKNLPPTNVCNIYFDNKAIEMINLSCILRDKSLKLTLPSTPNKFSPPMVTYKLSKSIASSNFNFKEFVENLDIDSYLNDKSILPCHCSNSPFVDPHHQHIVSGNLKIITNNKLRKLLSKGPKFRESRPLNWNKAKESIFSGLDDFLSHYCQSNALSKLSMAPWLYQVKKLVNDKLDDLEHKVKDNNISEKLKDSVIKNSLSELHDRYVITPIDKATGNVAFICKQFYADVLIKELGININDEHTHSDTYRSISNIDGKSIISNHVNKLKTEFNFDVNDENLCLPSVYWLPKMHKNPSKARFIIAAPKCSVKPLSKAINSIFKLFHQQIETYNKKCHFFTGVKTFWVALNNQPVIKTLNKINKHQRAHSVTTFDFSTLYTKIPHDKLLYVLNNLIDFCFDGGSSDFIAITRFGAKWIDNPAQYKHVFNKQAIKDAVKFLMFNCFFTIGNKIFQQIIGIPMGSDPAPFFANLFLYYYENKWLRKVQRSDLRRARRFANIFRFIDDLIAVNDGREFERCFKEIYPCELELGRRIRGIRKQRF